MSVEPASYVATTQPASGSEHPGGKLPPAGPTLADGDSTPLAPIPKRSAAPTIDWPTTSVCAEGQFILLQQLTVNGLQSLIGTYESMINRYQIEGKRLLDENLKKLKELVEKMNEAAAERKRGGIFRWITNIAKVVLSLSVFCAIVIGSGGMSVPVAIALGTMAFCSFASAYIDLLGQICEARGDENDGFSMKELTTEWGAAALSMNLAAVMGLVAEKEEWPNGLKIFVVVASTVVQMLLTLKFYKAAGSLSEFAQKWVNVFDTSTKISMICSGLAKVGESSIDIRLAERVKEIKAIEADMKELDAGRMEYEGMKDQGVNLLEELYEAIKEAIQGAKGVVTNRGETCESMVRGSSMAHHGV